MFEPRIRTRRPGPLRIVYWIVMLGGIAFVVFKLHQMLSAYGMF